MASGLKESGVHPSAKKGNLKECIKYWTISLISHASKILLKILQKRMERKVEEEVSATQAGVRRKKWYT